MQEKLLRRVIAFNKEFIDLIRRLSASSINGPIIDQAIRSATSIGANYHEVCEAESRKDFIHKLGICKKEARETLYWLELLAYINPKSSDEIRKSWKECREFVLIFSKAISTTRSKANEK